LNVNEGSSRKTYGEVSGSRMADQASRRIIESWLEAGGKTAKVENLNAPTGLRHLWD
jgi:hypothetical protein